jgi:hypothetical protein
MNKTKQNKTSHVMMACGFRSGAALTSSIINSHSEASFSVDIIKYWNYCFSRYPELNREKLIYMLEELQFRLSVRFSVVLDIDKCLELIGDSLSHVDIYLVVMNQILNKDTIENKIIGECEGLIWSKIPFFMENVPNSKSMIILRDPRDVLVSFKKNTIAPGVGYLVSVFNNVSLMQSWLDYEKIYEKRFLGIRFEELKSNTEIVTRRICNFLDLEYEPSMLIESKWTKLGKGGWVEWENKGTSSFSKEEKLKNNPVGRWRELIDPVDHFICEWIAGNMMKKFNIDLEFEDFSKDIFDEAVHRIMSSDLLRECFYNYICYDKGSEKYPINPYSSKNWSKLHNLDFEKFNSNKKFLS